MTTKMVALGARRRGAEALLELARHLKETGHVPVADRVTRGYVGAQKCRKVGILAHEAEERKRPVLAIALGGDGAFIQHAARYAPHGVPLVGVNLGRVGFLADIQATGMLDEISALLAGQGQDEQRLMLEVVHSRNGKVRGSQPVINDIVIDRGVNGTVIQLEVDVGRRRCVHVRGDGLIISTPGGSTAYNMAAGGPIITPDAGCITLTPLNPYSLIQRPLVFGADNEFVVTVINSSRLVPDGQTMCDLQANDTISVRAHKRKMTMRHPRGYDYFDKLHDKLYWRYD